MPALSEKAGDRAPISGLHAVEIADPAGDVTPIHSSDGESFLFDVVRLSLKTDGKRLTIAATLKDPPGAFASDVLELSIDTDNDPRTGAQWTPPRMGGFEYTAELNACVDYARRGSACNGRMKAEPTGHYAVVSLERFQGTGRYERETIIDLMGFSGKKKPPHVPISGTVVEASLEYADLNVVPGQTIRLVVKESHGSQAEDGGYFPEILLTLK